MTALEQTEGRGLVPALGSLYRRDKKTCFSGFKRSLSESDKTHPMFKTVLFKGIVAQVSEPFIRRPKDFHEHNEGCIRVTQVVNGHNT